MNREHDQVCRCADDAAVLLVLEQQLGAVHRDTGRHSSIITLVALGLMFGGRKRAK